MVQMELLREFLKMANMDLKSSKILYEHRLYPQSVFYFSQSVEKANKAFALTTGKYIEKDMLAFSHDPIKIYKHLINEAKKRYSNLALGLDELPDLKNTEFAINLDLKNKINGCDIEIKNLEDIRKRKEDLTFMPKREIAKIIKEIEVIEKELEEDILKIKNFELTEQIWNEQKWEVKKQLSNPNKELTSYIEKELNNSSISLQELETALKKMYLGASFLIIISYSLFYLAVITLPHSVTTRYPQNKLYPTKIYNSRLAIVQSPPSLFEVQSKTLKNLDKYCREYIFK